MNYNSYVNSDGDMLLDGEERMLGLNPNDPQNGKRLLKTPATPRREKR